MAASRRCSRPSASRSRPSEPIPPPFSAGNPKRRSASRWARRSKSGVGDSTSARMWLSGSSPGSVWTRGGPGVRLSAQGRRIGGCGPVAAGATASGRATRHLRAPFQPSRSPRRLRLQALPHVPALDGPGRWPDLGLWKRYPKAALVIPVDTHVARIARFVRLSTRATPDGRMAEEITAALRRCDPEDPLKYDFALSHLGILGDCPGVKRRPGCLPCPLYAACRAGR